MVGINVDIPRQLCWKRFKRKSCLKNSFQLRFQRLQQYGTCSMRLFANVSQYIYSYSEVPAGFSIYGLHGCHEQKRSLWIQ
jgi:hypothetical protein